MQEPLVTFVICCYKLGHYLHESVASVLDQSYRNLQVLILDDCSPDNTTEVARSFDDPRVEYIRNAVNLGALRNYNKGISLTRGKYLWMLSADDYLRDRCVVERYVRIMEANPRVGYAFCPGIGVRNGKETTRLEYSTYGARDRLVDGHIFLRRLIDYNLVLAPSAMARKECYERLGSFPLDVVSGGNAIDLIWGGDWYLWCLFALEYDVAYFAEPMVCYREHDLAMTHVVTTQAARNCFLADIAVPWMIKQEADRRGYRDVIADCLRAVAVEYARHLTSKNYRSSTSTITLPDFEDSLSSNSPIEAERTWVRSRTFAAVADYYYSSGAVSAAREFYSRALKNDPWMTKVWVKSFLLGLGRTGDFLRRTAAFGLRSITN